ncbi:hypothetical protein [[Actinomadura] parvosata]|uniref:hypothetical protein n=1 Tax=[Actinomadura] parvosata TaxID=1955412 RepID=UPI0012BBEC73|nr:hypothetical protein [Nonomuraea sp. ATCC 55076]
MGAESTAGSTLPDRVTEALEEYGRLLDEHGITWGEPEIHYVKFFARRRVLPTRLFDRFWGLVLKAVAESHPDEPHDRVAARLSEPDYDRVLRDTLDGELPEHLVAVRVEQDDVRLEGAPRTVLLPSEPSPNARRPGGGLPLVMLPGGEPRPARPGDGLAPAAPLPGRGEERISLLIDSSRDAPCLVSVDDAQRLLPRAAPGWPRWTRTAWSSSTASASAWTRCCGPSRRPRCAWWPGCPAGGAWWPATAAAGSRPTSRTATTTTAARTSTATTCAWRCPAWS